MNFIRPLIRKLFPEKFRPFIKTLMYYGKRVECPCCGVCFRKFPDYRDRPNAICPVCGALERHRLLWLYIKNNTDFLGKKIRLLHFAPEHVLSGLFSSLQNIQYVNADIASPRAMIRMDMTNMSFNAETFDAVICSHVLEHIDDDMKAMKEIYRVLKQKGSAILLQPVDQTREKTFEDPTVIDPQKRKALFGQEDHVRIYGRDIIIRIEKAGLSVSIEDYPFRFSHDLAERYGLHKDNQIYICNKI